jgi:hypothetical protein
VIAGVRAVTVVNRQTGESKPVACDCPVGGLTPMGAYLRLNELGTDPIWLLDAAGAEPRLVFVPAIAN